MKRNEKLSENSGKRLQAKFYRPFRSRSTGNAFAVQDLLGHEQLLLQHRALDFRHLLDRVAQV
jgi:hypothetical protein